MSTAPGLPYRLLGKLWKALGLSLRNKDDPDWTIKDAVTKSIQDGALKKKCRRLKEAALSWGGLKSWAAQAYLLAQEGCRSESEF